MFSWRITKYNPSYRNASGSYQKNEWSSFTDIGKNFDNKQLTLNDYLLIEDAYIGAIVCFMECNHINTMRVTNLEKQRLPEDRSSYSEEMVNALNLVANNIIADKETIKSIGRLILREAFWCKLKAKNMYVHFGYDYYMYIGSKNACNETVVKIEHSGLFVEEYDSPY